MLKTINVEEELERFLKSVIKQTKTNLTKKGINASKQLYNSFKRDLHIGPNSIDASILSDEYNDYGKFINDGVAGSKSGRSLSGYKYTTKKPPVNEIIKWMKVKPVKARDKKTGKFITQRQGAFAIQNAIFLRGIKPTEFFSRPFDLAFAKLPDELIEAYGLDVEQFMEFVLNKN